MKSLITKICYTCNKEKHIDDFYNSKTNKDGKLGSCKNCKSKYNVKFQRANLKAIEYRKTHRCKTGSIWNKNNLEQTRVIRNKSNRKGIEDLSDYYVKDKLRNKGFTKEQIDPNILEVQRLLLKTKRLCKTLQD
jgi:hypothetical protein